MTAEESGNEFALRDGDTLAFLGDSITAARNYSRIIEDYTLLRFPERRIRFLNAGQGGDTASGCLERLDRDVLDRGATVVTVAFGINDIGWGTKADEEHRRAYLGGITAIIERCRALGVRVFICSAAITAEKPESAENGYLQKMCDEGLELAKEKGAETIDVSRSMREVQRRVEASNEKEPDPKKQTRMHVEDGVHLNDLGQMAMAWAILKGLHAPAEVTGLSLDAATGSVVTKEGCEARDISLKASGGGFTRVDSRLPLNLHPLWMLWGWHMPISDDLNQYRLAISNLEPGEYEVLAGDRLLGQWNEKSLAGGLNLASATANAWEPGGPWDARGHALARLTTMRDELDQARRITGDFLKEQPGQGALLSGVDELEKHLVALQREFAQPSPVRFEIRKAVP